MTRGSGIAPVIPAMQRPLTCQAPLLRRAHLGQRVLVREEDVHYSRVEGLDKTLCFRRDGGAVLEDAAGLVPPDIGLNEKMFGTRASCAEISWNERRCRLVQTSAETCTQHALRDPRRCATGSTCIEGMARLVPRVVKLQEMMFGTLSILGFWKKSPHLDYHLVFIKPASAMSFTKNRRLYRCKWSRIILCVLDLWFLTTNRSSGCQVTTNSAMWLIGE